jgi:hypothetical protein
VVGIGPFHTRVAQSIAPATIRVASVQSSCYHGYFDPERAGRYGGVDEPQQPATVSLKPARPALRPEAN